MVTHKLLVIVMMSIATVCSSQGNKHPIRELLAVNGDTVLAAELGKGAIITYDGGKSWNATATDYYFKKMIVDNNGTIWAIDSWVGIHEQDHSKLYRSKDGKTWEEIIFDTNNFFPLEIISLPHQPLRIATANNKEYLLNGNNLHTDWKFVRMQPPASKEDAIIKGNYKLTRGNPNGKLLRKARTWDTVYHFKHLNAYDMYVKNNTVYVAGFLSGIEGKAYFASLANKKLKVYPIGSGHAYGIKEDNKGRIWVNSAEGIYILHPNKVFEKVY